MSWVRSVRMRREEEPVLAASDTEKQGRDKVVSWMEDADLKVVVDRIGNIFGIWETAENKDKKPLMIGSHIDTVINAGQYDGCPGGDWRHRGHQNVKGSGASERETDRGLRLYQ